MAGFESILAAVTELFQGLLDGGICTFLTDLLGGFFPVA